MFEPGYTHVCGDKLASGLGNAVGAVRYVISTVVSVRLNEYQMDSNKNHPNTRTWLR